MGGRGASSGMSDKGNEYGTQYHTVLEVSNIKFVEKNARNSEGLLETRTPGRVYVTVGGKDLLQVIYFDNNLKRSKTIDLSHSHEGMQPHVHHGYEHSEVDTANGVKKGATQLTTHERALLDKVYQLWHNHIRK